MIFGKGDPKPASDPKSDSNPPLLPGSAELTSVYCTTSTDCWAVGFVESAKSADRQVEHFAALVEVAHVRVVGDGGAAALLDERDGLVGGAALALTAQRAANASLEYKARQSQLLGRLGENLSAQPLVKAFNLQSLAIAQFREAGLEKTVLYATDPRR